MSELSILDLERETVELLPRREALGRKKGHHHYYDSTQLAIATNVSVIDQQSTAVALNFGKFGDATAISGNFVGEVNQGAVAANYSG